VRETVSDDWHPVGGPSDVSDSWDFDPDEDLPDTTYRGIRRAGGGGRRLVRLITVAVAVGVLVSVAIPVLLATRHPAQVLWAGDTAEPSTVVPPSVATSIAPTPTPSATPAATAAPTAKPKAFAPIVVEAEAKPPSVMRRNADAETLTGASGGRAVLFVEASSRIEIRNVTIPRAGRYRIAIDYASAAGGTIQVAVGASTATVALPASAQCCRSGAATLVIPAGRQRVTISRVSGTLAIDRIVITLANPST
jgi:hypothetical protein